MAAVCAVYVPDYYRADADTIAPYAAEYEGLIPLGAFSMAALSGSGWWVLSICGSEDQALNAEKYAANRVNLPAHFSEVVLEGGCHVHFGMHGPRGDGVPTIMNVEQIKLTARAIEALIGE